MKILVTGGAGFIGSWLAKALKERGDEITIVDDFSTSNYKSSIKEDRVKNMLDGIEIIRGDIVEPQFLADTLEKVKPEVIVHLAAIAGIRYAQKNPYAVIRANVEGTLSVFEQACRAGVGRVIYASSASVYGRNEKIPFEETDPVILPSSLYAATKRESELLAEVYRQIKGIKSTGIRFFTAYGPWGRPDMAYYMFTKAIFDGGTINLYAEGQAGRDFTSVHDVIRGIKEVIDHPETECDIVNLGNSHPITNGELLKKLEDIIGKQAKAQMKPLPLEDVPVTYADIAKAQRLYNWKPIVNIDDGLKEFVEWYRLYKSDK